MNSAIQQADHVVRKFSDEGKTFLEDRARKISNSIESHPSSESTIFSDNNDDWSYENEQKNRSGDAPYVLHRDEFFANEMDFRQATLTYYQGDDVLVDELDVPIYNADKIAGKLEFGKGSQDPNVVYVRNETLSAEYEILRDHGYYQVEILGQAVENEFDDDVKHSVRKFRTE